MAIRDVVTMGYGSFSNRFMIPRLGYGVFVEAGEVPCPYRPMTVNDADDQHLLIPASDLRRVAMAHDEVRRFREIDADTRYFSPAQQDVRHGSASECS